MEKLLAGLVTPHGKKGSWALGQVFTWSKSSCSMRSVELILSTTLSDPLYSITALPKRISLLDIVTTKSPFSKNSPLLLDKAVDEKRELTNLLPMSRCLKYEIILWKAESWEGKEYLLFSQTGWPQMLVLPLASYVALGTHFPSPAKMEIKTRTLVITLLKYDIRF